MKKAFYFTSKDLFFLKIFKFLSWLFGHVAKRLDKKDKVNFKFFLKNHTQNVVGKLVPDPFLKN